MDAPRASSRYPLAVRWLWYILLALLPLTSVPVLVRLVGSDTVAAPSGVLLALLILFWFLPYLFRRGTLPRQCIPLLLFAVLALFVVAASSFVPLPAYKGISPLRNEFEALVTLAIGISFYLVASTLPSDEKVLAASLRVIHWSGLVVILWSFAQAAAWAMDNRYPEWMRNIQDLLSIGPLYRQRVTGLALEPSWLAHQLNMLYLPLWLGLSVRRASVFRFRLLGLQFEDFLLAGGVAVLALTLSRVGQLAFALMLGYLLLRLNLYLARLIQQRAANNTQKPSSSIQHRAVFLLILMAMLVVYLGLLAGAGFIASRIDPRMRDVFFFDYGHDNPILRYANQLTFASRVVYWQAGWEIFNDHPLIGVGLGNAGFYFPGKLSGYAYGLFEVRDLLFRSNNLLNIKSIWVRLLAETGLIGFALFASWLFLYYNTTRWLDRFGERWHSALALFGQLVFFSLLVEGFSIDSFALPYLWISVGLVTAAYRVAYAPGLEHLS